MLLLPNRRLFLGAAAASMGNLLVRDWTVDVPERFTEGSAGARVALFNKEQIFGAQRAGFTYKWISPTELEAKINENVVWENNGQGPMEIHGVVCYIPIKEKKSMLKMVYPFGPAGQGITLLDQETFTMDHTSDGTGVRPKTSM